MIGKEEEIKNLKNEIKDLNRYIDERNILIQTLKDEIFRFKNTNFLLQERINSKK